MAVETPIYRAIAEGIRQRILSGDLRPGETLPSYRSLIKEHGSTFCTVRQAMMALQQDGLIHTKLGRGSVVAGPPKKKWSTVGLVFIGRSEGVRPPSELKVLHDQFEQLSCDISIRFVSEVNQESLAKLVDWVKRLDGVVLKGRVPVRVTEIVAGTGVPTIQFGEPLDGPCPSDIRQVSFDTTNVMHLAAVHLVSLGHRRIALCGFPEAYSRYSRLLAQSFRKVTEEYGLSGEVAEWAPAPSSSNPGKSLWPERLDPLLNRPDPPTALLVETRAGNVIHWLNEHGWSVPDRISVMSLTGETVATHGLTSVHTPVDEALACCARLAAELIHGGACGERVKYVQPTFSPGTSTRFRME